MLDATSGAGNDNCVAAGYVCCAVCSPKHHQHPCQLHFRDAHRVRRLRSARPQQRMRPNSTQCTRLCGPVRCHSWLQRIFIYSSTRWLHRWLLVEVWQKQWQNFQDLCRKLDQWSAVRYVRTAVYFCVKGQLCLIQTCCSLLCHFSFCLPFQGLNLSCVLDFQHVCSSHMYSIHSCILKCPVCCCPDRCVQAPHS